MSKSYEQVAKIIVDNVGGVENIINLHHCQTRLRFKLKNDTLVNQEVIADLEEVPKVLVSGGQFQVVIGMDVADAYDEVMAYMISKGYQDTEQLETTVGDEKKSIVDTVSEFVSSIFSPIIPALAGAGMVKALLAIMVTFKWVDPTDQTYIIINMIGDATFAFLPMLLAYTTAQKLKINPFLSMVIAGIMVHATWGEMVTAANPVSLFGIVPLYLVKYTNSVIPIVLVVLAQAPIEKFLNRVIPKSLRLVFAPMVLFLIMGVLALAIIGPIGDYVGTVFTFIFTWLSQHIPWAPAFLMGGLYSSLVIFGLHHGLAPLGFIQLSQMGYDSIFGPGVLLANIGQGTASLTVGLLSKDSKTRQIGLSSGVTGLMGITEPALYGLNVPKKYPLIAGMIGGAAGGLFAGLFGIRRFATGSSGLPAVVMYIGDNTMRYFYAILAGVGITIVVSAIATIVLYKHFEKESEDLMEPLLGATNTVESNNLSLQNSEILTISSPIKGSVIPLSEIDDDVFSQGLIGNGFGILPEDNILYAPFDGTVTTIFPTKHAIGLISENGVELLIHIGLDTVELNGKFFETFVQIGQVIKRGQKLVAANFQKISEHGFGIQIPIIITNSMDYEIIENTNKYEVDITDTIMAVKRKKTDD